jgi:hypothetical protein
MTVGTMLRDSEFRKNENETTGQLACILSGPVGGWEASCLALRKQVRAGVLPVRKRPGWSLRERHWEVESEAVATPIIIGILAIESEETL